MEKNTAGKWIVFAYGNPSHASAGLPITGDAANITANVRIDGAAANAVDDVNPTELEDGYYIFDITAAEANGDNILLTPQSGTANVLVIGVPGAVWTRPANFPALGIEVGGAISTLNGHTVQTADHTAGIADIPTTAEFEARTLVSASYLTGAAASTAVWGEALPGAFTQGEAGHILGHQIHFTGSVTTGGSFVLFTDTSIPSGAGNNDFYSGAFVTFTSGNNAGQTRVISDWSATTTSFLLKTSCNNVGVAGDEYTVWGNPADIWHANTSDYQGSLTPGLIMNEWENGGRLDLLLDDVPTTAEFDARTIASADYFDPAADTVATVTSVTNEVTADVTKISGDATAANNLEASMETLLVGTATGGSTSTVTSAATGHGDDTFIGRLMVMRTGTLQYEAGVVTDYDSVAGTFTFAASTWTTAPTTETWVIV